MILFFSKFCIRQHRPTLIHTFSSSFLFFYNHLSAASFLVHDASCENVEGVLLRFVRSWQL